ncbi:MAG TPA: elongation factor G [Thermodesulfobacteriota bacterium]|nr:elongation factor G [Thermodesulfobacteriota bacterium]
MPSPNPEAIRNVALIAHDGAGKSLLVEAMLFDAKAIPNFSRLTGNANAVVDTDPEEIKRNFTLSSAVYHLSWKGHLVNLVDTPGYANFIPDARTALRAVDAALVLISAAAGVKLETERFWQLADELEVPRAVFVNRLDEDQTSFLRTVDDLERTLQIKPVPVQMPVGEGSGLRGVVDLLGMRAHLYAEPFHGKGEVTAVPAEVAAEAERLRQLLVDEIAAADDRLTERYLEGETLSTDDLYQGLREALLTRKFVPVLCGSAHKNIGIQPLLDFIALALPTPLTRAPARGRTLEGEPAERRCDPAEPFLGLVFKTAVDPFSGRLSAVRILSGTLRPDSVVYNATRRAKERVSRLFKLEGKSLVPAEEGVTGDIVALQKLSETLTGDTLCDEKHPIVLPAFEEPKRLIAYAIKPKGRADEEKMIASIHRLIEEDPTLALTRDPQTKEVLLQGMGPVHLEVAVERLKRKYDVEVELLEPKVPYKETIRGRARVQGKHKKQTGGRGQYGDVWLEVEPLPRGGGFQFENRIFGGVVPKQYVPAVEKGILEAMEAGPLAGFPVVDVKVALVDGSHHPVDSSELAFKIAGSLGFKKAVQEANPVLLEPILKFEVTVPEEYMGAVIGDLNARRGRILGLDPQARGQRIRALVPMAEVLRYAADLRSLTAGTGVFTMEFSHYEEVPTHLAAKIIEEARREAAKEAK